MISAGAKDSSSRSDRGASLVEFALLAPVLFSLLLGMITGGLALSAKNSITNAVREGARTGATLPYDASWDGNVRAAVLALAGGDLESADICVQMVEDVSADPDAMKPPGCPDGPALPAGATACVVRVWAQTDATLNALFFSRDLDLTAEAVGRYERDGCP